MTEKGHIQTDREMWANHRHNAENRGVEFRLTFEEWVTWWAQELGPDWRLLRGAERNKFVMARHGDAGPYELGNIKCVTHAENIQERHRALTPDQIREVFTSGEPYKVLQARFGISRGLISDIRCGRRHGLITKGLERPPILWGTSRRAYYYRRAKGLPSLTIGVARWA